MRSIKASTVYTFGVESDEEEGAPWLQQSSHQARVPQAWRVHKRYKDFKALDDKVRKLCGGTEGLSEDWAPLPSGRSCAPSS